MTHISQDLHNAFPEDAETLRLLKADNAHFQALAARFEAIDDEARRIDEGLEAASDERLDAIKKTRLALLDDIAVIVTTARAA
ncbi:MAG: GTP-binding protein [Sandarakinorhabdus sp.]|nr:GTP-binding protein [Sandarakinorhabdus sp.]